MDSLSVFHKDTTWTIYKPYHMDSIQLWIQTQEINTELFQPCNYSFHHQTNGSFWHQWSILPVGLTSQIVSRLCCFGCSDNTHWFPPYAKETLSIESQCKIWWELSKTFKSSWNHTIFSRYNTHMFALLISKLQEKWCCILPKIAN